MEDQEKDNIQKWLIKLLLQEIWQEQFKELCMQVNQDLI
jgi:hypothetical protein